MDEDEVFESLPPKLRKQVLAHWSGDVEVEVVESNPEPVSLKFLIPALIIGTPISLLGFLLTCTILFAPIGIPVFLLGAMFPYRALKKHARTED